jgi:hypothetical protein
MTMATELAPWEMDSNILRFKQERQARAVMPMNVERPRMQEQMPPPQAQYGSARKNYNIALEEVLY